MASRPRFQRPSREYPTPSPEKERRWVRAANQPRSTGFRAGGCSRGVQHRFLTYTFPSRSPRPTHPAVLNRRDFVEAAPTLTGDSRIRLPPASLRRYDDKEMDGLSPPSENSSASWRTSTAPTPRRPARHHRQAPGQSSARPSPITPDPHQGDRGARLLVAVLIQTGEGACAGPSGPAYPHYCSLLTRVDSAEADRLVARVPLLRVRRSCD